MDASNLPKGQSSERTDGREINRPGVYIHKDTNTKFITAPGEAGIIQADSLMSPIWQNAWEWIADVPSRTELLAQNKAQEVKDKAAEVLKKEQEEAELQAATKAAIKAAKESVEVEAELAVK